MIQRPYGLMIKGVYLTMCQSGFALCSGSGGFLAFQTWTFRIGKRLIYGNVYTVADILLSLV